MSTWRGAFGYYEGVSPSFADVKQRYQELKEIRKGDSYAIAQLNEGWKEFQRDHEYKSA